MPVNDNDSGNIVKLNPAAGVANYHEVLVCKSCDCVEFNLVRQDDQVIIFCAECDEQY